MSLLFQRSMVAAKLLSSGPSHFNTVLLNSFSCTTSVGTLKTPSDSSNKDEIIFRQLFDQESYTLTYLLGCAGQGLLVDPVLELWERDLTLATQLGLTLKYLVNTHVHADHITASGLLKQKVPHSRSVLGARAGAQADLMVGPGDTLELGALKLEVRETPGHTNGCITLVLPSLGLALTGDALLVRGCGRTDFQEGDPAELYRSVHGNILSLPDHYRLYPAHDYTGQTVTTVAEEKRFNPRLTKTLPEFVHIMNNLGLSYPKKIDESLPANRVCGLYNIPAHLPQPLPEGEATTN